MRARAREREKRKRAKVREKKKDAINHEIKADSIKINLNCLKAATSIIWFLCVAFYLFIHK